MSSNASGASSAIVRDRRRQLDVPRPGDVLGEVTAVFDGDDRVTGVVDHQRGNVDRRQDSHADRSRRPCR